MWILEMIPHASGKTRINPPGLWVPNRIKSNQLEPPQHSLNILLQTDQQMTQKMTPQKKKLLLH